MGANPNLFWNQFDCVLYNTAVGPGASFDLEHYDCLFAVFSINGVTPIELYQMISRIRNFKTNKVTILLLENESKIDLTYEQRYYQLRSNICDFETRNLSITPTIQEVEHTIDFPQMQQVLNKCFPNNNNLLGKRTNNNSMLTLNNYTKRVLTENGLGNIFTKRKHYKMVFEDDEYISLIARFSIVRELSTETFCNKLCDLIIKNGGLIYHAFPILTDKLRKNQVIFKKLVSKSLKENCSFTYLYPEGIVPDIKLISKHIDTNNTDAHYNYLRLVKNFDKDYKSELVSVIENYFTAKSIDCGSDSFFRVISKSAKKALTLYVVYPEILKNLQELFKILQIGFVDGYFKGSFTSVIVYNNLENILILMRNLKCELDKKSILFDIKRNENKKTSDVRSITLSIKRLLEIFGLKLQREKKSFRVVVGGVRITSVVYQVDQTSQKLRYATAGINPYNFQTQPNSLLEFYNTELCQSEG